MADHINIHEPWSKEAIWTHYREVARLKAELDLANQERDSYRSDLDAIFTRIKDGKTVELHYPGQPKIIVAALSSAPEGGS